MRDTHPAVSRRPLVRRLGSRQRSRRAGCAGWKRQAVPGTPHRPRDKPYELEQLPVSVYASPPSHEPSTVKLPSSSKVTESTVPSIPTSSSPPVV